MEYKPTEIQDQYTYLINKAWLKTLELESQEIDSYNNYDVKPEFKATENFFIVTLPNLNYIENESINDQINDLGLAILQILNVKPGLRIPELILEIENNGIETTVDKVRNEIRRNLRKYVKHRGSNKTGGYYLKDRHIDKQDKVE